jgi:hypothetical protein
MVGAIEPDWVSWGKHDDSGVRWDGDAGGVESILGLIFSIRLPNGAVIYCAEHENSRSGRGGEYGT